MKVNEFTVLLQTFELGISKTFENKKIITFVSNTKDSEDECHLDTDKGISNFIVLLGR